MMWGSLMVLFSCSTEYQGSSKDANLSAEFIEATNLKASKASAEIIDGVNGGVVGISTLHRNANGITLNFKCTGLMPGHAYTIWWVVWNSPENCAAYPEPCDEPDFENAEAVQVEVLAATGHVVGANGIGNFSAHLKENDSNGTVNPLFGLPEFGGLHNAESAEIHPVLRSHGPAIPGMVNEQISTYEGGCTDPFAFLPFSEIPDEEGECGDIYFAIHQP